MDIEISEFTNGVRLATATRTGFASAGVAVGAIGGVRAQESGESGYAHLLEHLLFGTADSRAVFEGLDGCCNAVTGREHLALCGFVPATEAARTVGAFVDALLSPDLSARSIAAERSAIEREVEQSSGMESDDLDQLVVETVWPGHVIAQPQLGKPGDLADASPEKLMRFHKRMVRAPATFVVAVGAVCHAQLETAAGKLTALPSETIEATQAVPRFAERARRDFRSAQSTVVWVLPAGPWEHCAAPDLELLQQLLGSIRSPLYRLLRNELRLVYGLSVRVLRYSDAGALVVEARTHSTTQLALIRACESYFERLTRHGFSEEEFCLAQKNLAARGLVDADRLEWQLDWLAERLMHPLRDSIRDLATLNQWLRYSWSRSARLMGIV